MRFKVGDKIWYYFVGVKQAEVVSVFPNTNRYKIKDEEWEHFESAENVYGSRKEYFESHLKIVNKRIESLEIEKKKTLQELKK